jgi:hypothetical protein
VAIVLCPRCRKRLAPDVYSWCPDCGTDLPAPLSPSLPEPPDPPRRRPARRRKRPSLEAQEKTPQKPGFWSEALRLLGCIASVFLAVIGLAGYCVFVLVLCMAELERRKHHHD